MPNRRKPASAKQTRRVPVPMTGAEWRRARKVADAAGQPLAALMRKWFFERAEAEKLG